MIKVVVNAAQATSLLSALDAGGYEIPVLMYTLDYNGNVSEVLLNITTEPLLWIKLTEAFDLDADIKPIFNNLTSSQYYQVTAFTQ